MLFTQFAFSALVLGASASQILNERFVDDGFNALTKRQQFIPTTQTAAGDSCADAFGDGYMTCREKTDAKNRLCYNPQAGQTCCSSSWACPSGSFCLVDPYCCPTGQDVKECAADNGIALPDSFTTSSTSSYSAQYTAYNSTSSVSSHLATYTASSSYYVAPYSTAANTTTVIKATGTAKVYPTVAVASPFPGAANQASFGFGVAAAGLLGFIATLF